MASNDSTTDDNATEDEEKKEIPDVTSNRSHENNETSVTKWENSSHKLKGVGSKCSGSGDETTLNVWCEGQTCLAPYSGDNEYYEAVINSIQKTSSGKRKVVVTFIGYESNGTETVSARALKTIRKQPDNINKKDTTSLSNRKKKGKLHVSIQHNRRLLRSGKSKNKRNNSLLVEDFEEGQYERIRKKKTAKPLDTSHDDAIEKKDDKDEFDDEMIADGFDDQDMERPSFTEPAPHPSVSLRLSQPGIQPATQVPATINRYLRDYQRDGVRFLFRHFSENTGAILGDDMGLGKTVQVIAFIVAVLGKTGTKADIFCKFMNGKTKRKQKEEVSQCERGIFLIVSPGSVMYNWKEELETWGHFNTGLFHANAKEDTLQRAHRGRLDVVLTTYETMRNHLDELNKIEWLAVIMDEVHRLKDRKAQITVAAKALKAKRRYGLTGTPLQNKLEEFWCVLDWANPGSLGKVKLFELEFGKPMRKGQTFDATKRELALGRKKSKDLQDKIGKCFLRRTKDLIANQLPNKDELVVFCPLAPFQEDVYQTLLQNPDVELIRRKNFPCDCGSGVDRGKCCYMLSSDNEDIKTVTMRFFQLLLKVANHAALLAPTVKQTLDQQEKAKELCLRVFSKYPEFSGRVELSPFELLSDPKYCGKMKVLDKLLGISRDERSKVLLFSRSTQLLDILEEFVISKGLVYSRLDGATKPADRPRLVREFNLDPSISLCLISTKAGGLGLNFTGANVVIIFDPNWNPSCDLQAQDRAYRIGQRRDVRVYRLISSGTIEEMIYLRQVYKQQLANIAIKGTNERRYFTGVEGDKDRHGELFGLENLFSYRAESASLSKDIVKRTEKLEAGYKVAKYEIVLEKKLEKGLEGEVANNPVNPDVDDDPYNLEEIASQLIDDEVQGDLTDYELSDHSRVVEKQEEDLNSDTSKELRSEKNNDDESLAALENNDSSFSDLEDLLRHKGTSSEAFSKSVVSKSMDSSMNSAARKRVFSDDSSSLQGESNEPESLTSNFTRIKKNWSKFSAAKEESCDVIPPTASSNRGVKARISNEFYTDDDGQSSKSSDGNSPEMASSSEEEDSDEGMFTRSKEKRKPPKMVCGEQSNLLKEGRKRLRRFPGKKTPNIEVNRKSVTAKRSRKDNTVEQILESCGVHYTHASRHIVGPSEAENHMTKQALQDVFEFKQFSQQPANCFPALEASDESDDLGESAEKTKPEAKKPREQPEAETSRSNPTSLNRSLKIDSGATVERIGSSTVFVGSTPRGIRRLHFRKMSSKLGFSSDIDFAEAVVKSSGTERWEMLKRYYVDKNPVLSGLSIFTACEVKSAVDNSSENVKCAKRSSKRTPANDSHETSKKSKRNLHKHKAKVKMLRKDVIHEENRERHEIQEQDGDDSPSRMLRLSVASEEKQAVNLKNSTYVIESKHCFNNPAKNEEEGDISVDLGNYRTHARGCQSNHRNQSLQEDGRCSSKESRSNRGNTANIQGLPVVGIAAASVSILDEFLSDDSDSVGGKSKNENITVGKMKSCSDHKHDDHLVKKDWKETVQLKKKPTSVLDEFI